MTASLPPDDILLQVTPKLSIAEVWEGFVRPERLQKWLAPRVRLEPVEGGPFELFWDLHDPAHDSTLGCKIVRIRKEEELVFTWKGPPLFDAVMNRGPPPTEVSFRVAPCPEGIDVTLEHKGWGTGEEWERARSWHFYYWQDVLARFKEYVMSGTCPGPPSRAVRSPP